MIGYPIDSHVTFNSQGIPSYDRAISSEPLRKLIKNLFSDGVLPNPSTNMQVQSGEGMSVIVNSGFAICNGCMKLEEKTRTLVVQASSTSLDRIDTVILRLNNNEDVRSLDFYILQGTPATNPVRPALTQNDTIWEIGLADLFIASNTSVISNSRITDTRYETARCGIISSISEFDTTTLYNQVQSDLDEFRNVSEEEFRSWINTIQSDFESWKRGEEVSFEAWMTKEKNDFDVWFATIQDKMSGDVAANLQRQIGALPTLDTENKIDLVQAINEVNTKTPNTLPTTHDAGKAPIVQDDGSIAWGTVSTEGGGAAKFTQAEWDALPQTERDKYDGKEVIITDDYESNICSSVQECADSTNPNDVAGASAVSEVAEELNDRTTLENVNSPISTVNIKKMGKLVFIFGIFKLSKAMSANEKISTGFPKSIATSFFTAFDGSGNPKSFYISVNGELCSSFALSVTGNYYFSHIYITN